MKTGGEIPGALVPVSLERRAGRRIYGHDSQVHIEYETQNYDGISAMEFYDIVAMASTLKCKTLQTRGVVLQEIKQLVPVQRWMAVFTVQTKKGTKELHVQKKLYTRHMRQPGEGKMKEYGK